jgi:hypothetical protein
VGEGDPEDRPDGSRQLVVVPEREPLTEAEARRIGVAADRLARLRHLRAEATTLSGSITIGNGGGFGAVSHTVPLGSADLQAAISVLIERDELLLASFNVKIERPE